MVPAANVFIDYLWYNVIYFLNVINITLTMRTVVLMNNKKSISIKRIIIVIFIIFLFSSISLYGALVFTNWISSSKKTTEHLAKDIHNNIQNQVESFIYVPYHINQVNHLIIKNNLIDISDEVLRNKFFVGILNSHNDDIYSFSYGTKHFHPATYQKELK